MQEIIEMVEKLQEEVDYQLHYEEDVANNCIDMVTTLSNVAKLLEIVKSMVDRPQI